MFRLCQYQTYLFKSVDLPTYFNPAPTSTTTMPFVRKTANPWEQTLGNHARELARMSNNTDNKFEAVRNTLPHASGSRLLEYRDLNNKYTTSHKPWRAPDTVDVSTENSQK